MLIEEILDIFIEKGVICFDIVSIDCFYKKAGVWLMELAELFEFWGVNGEDKDLLVDK